MMILIVSGVIIILLLVAFSIYSELEKAAEQEAEKKAIAEQRAAEEEALAEQLAADEKALREGDLSVVENVAKHALPSSELIAKPLYEGWVKSEHSGGKLSELYQYSNGEKNGFSVAWHPNGNKKIESNYKDGKQHGLVTLYQENGQKKYEQTTWTARSTS